MTTFERVHLVVPEVFDDPRHPSGGNRYDQELLAGLRARGRQVEVVRVSGGWPQPDHLLAQRLSEQLAAVPDGAVTLVDGLITSAAGAALAPHLQRLCPVVLLHMPLAPSCPPEVAASERAALAGAAGVIVTSDWTRDQVLQTHGLSPSTVTVARPGAHPAPLHTGTPEGDRLAHIAPLLPHKGGDVLVAALMELTGLDWHCSWVGRADEDGPYAHDVLRTVRGLGDRIHMYGVLGGAQLDRTWEEVDLLVVPSRSETYGMVASEALARGIPVVASDVGGLPEALGTDPQGEVPGRLIPAGDPAVLAAALRDWLTDATVRAAWRAAAAGRRSGLLGWEHTAEVVDSALRHARKPEGVNPMSRPFVSYV